MSIHLDGRGSLYEQVYRGLRGLILDGVFGPGSKLPTSRAMGKELGVSRNTMLNAYQQLVDEGYAQGIVGSGTFVARSLPDEARRPGAQIPSPKRRLKLSTSSYAQRLLKHAPRAGASWRLPRHHLPYDFRYGEPAYNDLPLETWSRLLGRIARNARAGELAYGEPAGPIELRQALAGYLRRARGVVCEPEQILITQGSQQAIDLIARVLVDAGDRVVLEEPHYTGFSFVMGSSGAELISVPTDSNGLQVDNLDALDGIRAVCVTPSHQFPSGGVLSLERRLSLLSWAERENTIVIEDDYDGEYRYEGRPVPSLQSLDQSGHVLYVGTASKLLFPSLRIGWLVVPQDLVRVFTIAKAFTDTGSSGLEQRVLAEFIKQGHLERHVRRTRVRNAARRKALEAAVSRELEGIAELQGTQAGLHGVLWVPELPGSREQDLRRAAAERGVGIYPVHPYYRRRPRKAGFVLGYAALTEREIDEGIRRLAVAIKRLH